MFGAVFTGEVQACLRSSIDEARRQNRGLRIRLHLTKVRAWSICPGSISTTAASTVSLALSVDTPLVHYMELPERDPADDGRAPDPRPCDDLSPSGLPAARRQGGRGRLDEALADLIEEDRSPSNGRKTRRLDELQRRLRRSRYHIFHFIGHGGFDQAQQDGILDYRNQRKAAAAASAASRSARCCTTTDAEAGGAERLRRRARVARAIRSLERPRAWCSRASRR